MVVFFNKHGKQLSAQVKEVGVGKHSTHDLGRRTKYPIVFFSLLSVREE